LARKGGKDPLEFSFWKHLDDDRGIAVIKKVNGIDRFVKKVKM